MSDLLVSSPSGVEGLVRHARSVVRSLAARPVRLVGVVGALGVVVAVVWLAVRSPSHAPLALPRADSATSVVPATTEISSAGAEVVVYVAGAVGRPGLVRLSTGARVAECVAAAGGLLATADAERVNLAAPVRDGERVFIPIRGQAVPAVVTGDSSSEGDAGAPAVVDLNTATLEQLDSLPGVGPATAAAILDYRRRNGAFSSVDRLLDVPGIGDAKLARLRPYVKV